MQLRELIDAIVDAEDVPDDVKHVIIARLRDVEEAIEHIEVGGPHAVRMATEAVMGSVAFTRDIQVAKSQTVQRVWTTLLVIWTAFSAGPPIQDSLEAWHDLVPLLQTENSTPPTTPAVREAAPDEDGREANSP